MEIVGIFFVITSIFLGPEPGEPAPNFTLPDTSYTNHSLSDFKGKVVLLNFWVSW